MEISLPSLLLGGAGVGVGYFAYLCATKGIPAAWVWLKSKVSAGSAELAQLKADFAAVEARVAALEARGAPTAPAAPPQA